MSHPEPPVWLLDVDGVINAYRGGWYTSPHIVQIYSEADAYDYRIRFEPRGELEFTWYYPATTFDGATVATVAGAFADALRGIAEDCRRGKG